ncbi:unnamed protein product [Callosobruchus maculatus]|uniref:Uncharacterized protein n=1 Tax=Callosobruchus maculatus TaxID=64391 RepID=A0A653CY82_CALMS|nr:unnamed protein product [Callosobruchus maculatus]
MYCNFGRTIGMSSRNLQMQRDVSSEKQHRKVCYRYAGYRLPRTI